MITVIELVCKQWEHEVVNAGMLDLIEKSSKETITFFSNNDHAKAVSQLNNSLNISFCSIYNKTRFDNESEVGLCIKLINQCMNKAPSSKVIFTAAYYPEIIAIKRIAKVMRNKKFYVCMHGMLEEKFGNQARYDELIRDEQPNVFFITYSDSCKKRYEAMGLKNIRFIHHPYLKSETIVDRKRISEGLTIGIIGGCANQNARRIIDEVRRRNEIYEKCKFIVMTSNVKMFRNYKRCTVTSDFERKTMERVMAEVDYILIPYGKKDYRVSASGVLWDAVSQRVPIIGYDSYYLKYYQDKIKIGYLYSSLHELVAQLERIVLKGIYEESFFIGTDNLMTENMVVMTELLRG